MQVREAVFGTAGVIATAFGLGLLVVPGLLLGIGPVEALVTTLEGTEPTTLALLAGFVATGYLLIAARARPDPDTVRAASSADTRFDLASTAPPETPRTDRRTVAGSAVDDEFRAAIDHGGESLGDVRGELFEVAAAVYAEVTDATPERARRAVASGEWTTDPVATVFLAGAEGPTTSVSMRLRLWLVPDRERRRRIERTITAIERLQDQA